MSDVAKVIRLRDSDFEARQRPATRQWPSRPALRPVTSLTGRSAPASPSKLRSLCDLAGATIVNAVPRRLPLPGADAGGVLYLRSVDDSDRLRAALSTVSAIAIVISGPSTFARGRGARETTVTAPPAATAAAATSSPSQPPP
ncbi:hypothetical protein C5E45_34440 [Nocardia nova]|uniref:Uncharacterized protein n=1 Tax=Nocardia nova TaxID=37330 RepID=A0A2S6A707_9NOCA|nr:hypothetical protein C5E41_31535 [Nocardia nova]PPJ28497.1 hypothetical protein C5E45_34440 [Nocardia nova]